jgi:hypothetical protein
MLASCEHNHICISNYPISHKPYFSAPWPKTKKRLEMEHIHELVLDTERRGDRMWCGPNKKPAMDVYGRLSFL